MTVPIPVTFRAGRKPGETPAFAVSDLAPRVDTPGIVLMADISQFQPQIADAVYLQWSKAVIIRAMYGQDMTDRSWFGGQRRSLLLQGGAQFLGIYQYLRADQDAAAQAKALAQLLGTLNKGEYVIADIEEGTGSQQARWQSWAGVINAELGFPPGDYSGLNFAAAHGLTPVDWVAAYGTTEPAVQHLFWQFTDAMTIPGVPGLCDCSIFHGNINELAALAFGGQQPQPPPNQPFPAPTGLKAGTPHVSLPVSWNPVTLNGVSPPSYTVAAYGLDGNRYANVVVPGPTCLLTGLTHGWTYHVRVWANGGPVSPPHAEITVSV